MVLKNLQTYIIYYVLISYNETTNDKIITFNKKNAHYKNKTKINIDIYNKLCNVKILEFTSTSWFYGHFYLLVLLNYIWFCIINKLKLMRENKMDWVVNFWRNISNQILWFNRYFIESFFFSSTEFTEQIFE